MIKAELRQIAPGDLLELDHLTRARDWVHHFAIAASMAGMTDTAATSP